MILTADIEIYPNYSLFGFMDVETEKFYHVQGSPSTKIDVVRLARLLKENTIVGFNSFNYDVPIMQLALQGHGPHELYLASRKIIYENLTPWEFADVYDLPKHDFDHIDLFNVAPLKGSLKIYAGRLHCKTMADLPFDPNREVTADEAKKLKAYNHNDLRNTALLYANLREQLALRETLGREYGQDLRSRSDAQIAEKVIASEVGAIIGGYPKRPEGARQEQVSYEIPHCVHFIRDDINRLVDILRVTKLSLDGSGSPIIPDCLSVPIRIGYGTYRLGVGGLHSSEKSVYHLADEHTLLVDRDVASYYPAIILTQRLFPKHMGPAFLQVYGNIVARRLAAKAGKRKMEAESLKIVINGGFGKFGNKYSSLYAPELLTQVTISGQLYLLMLIESIEAAGIPVVSANTDGIIIKCPKERYDELNQIISAWELVTQMKTEETRYKGVYSRDVNAYIAIYEDGKDGIRAKGKNLFADHWATDGPNIYQFHKNPTNTICIQALVALFDKGTPISDTIRSCTDIRKFITVRTVAGGALTGATNEYLGKAIRFYYARGEKSVMRYKKSGNKVPRSEQAKELMTLPDALPDDIAYDWYIRECHRMLLDVGWLQRGLFQ